VLYHIYIYTYIDPFDEECPLPTASFEQRRGDGRDHQQAHDVRQLVLDGKAHGDFVENPWKMGDFP